MVEEKIAGKLGHAMQMAGHRLDETKDYDSADVVHELKTFDRE